MKLYVIRHGQTKCNKENKYNCRLDEDINEIGIKQAEEASKIVKNLDIDLIICSPMIRTKHTCEIVNVNNIPVIYDERIMERDGGVLTNTTIDETGIAYIKTSHCLSLSGLSHTKKTKTIVAISQTSKDEIREIINLIFVFSFFVWLIFTSSDRSSSIVTLYNFDIS